MGGKVTGNESNFGILYNINAKFWSVMLEVGTFHQSQTCYFWRVNWCFYYLLDFKSKLGIAIITFSFFCNWFQITLGNFCIENLSIYLRWKKILFFVAKIYWTEMLRIIKRWDFLDQKPYFKVGTYLVGRYRQNLIYKKIACTILDVMYMLHWSIGCEFCIQICM